MLQMKISINRTIEFLKIAFPAILESLVSVIIATIDTKMIACLGKPAISAVSFTTQPKLIFFSGFFALGTTVSILVAQAYGKRDEREANYYFYTILKIAIIFSMVIGIIIAVLAEPVMRICNHQDDTLHLSVSFFRIIMGFMIFQVLSTVINAALRGIGKTKVTLVSNVAMGITDILFNYLLIEGRLGFPRLEIRGDAVATVLGSIAACVISIIAICTQNDFIHLKGLFTEKIFSDRERLGIIFSKAGNIVFENLFMRIGFLVSSAIVSMLSSGETAVYAVAMILLNYSFAFGDGIQSAVVALTGRAYGAGDYKAFLHYFRIALVFGVICSVMLGIIYNTTSEVYYKAFFTDRRAIDDGSRYSGYAAVLTLLQIIRIADVGAMRGMGEVKTPRIIATICVTVVSPLFTYVMAIPAGYGVEGFWSAAVISQGLWFVMAGGACYKHMKRLKGELLC